MSKVPRRSILSIVIVNWNTRDMLARCLRSIYDTKGPLSIEVFVVDNASSDDSVAMARRDFPKVRLIANTENMGFGRANNQGMRASTGLYLLLLNSDTEVLPGTLQELVRFVQATPEAGMAGAKLLFADGSQQTSHGRLPTLFTEMLNMLGLVVLHSTSPAARSTAETDGLVETDWLLGACMMVRREVFETTGGFDEDYFMYTEEIDWCRRVKTLGWRVYFVPTAHIVHYWRASTSQARDWMKAELYKSKCLYFRKHDGLLAEIAFKLTVLVTSAIKAALYSAVALFRGDQRQKARMWWFVAMHVI